MHYDNTTAIITKGHFTLADSLVVFQNFTGIISFTSLAAFGMVVLPNNRKDHCKKSQNKTQKIKPLN